MKKLILFFATITICGNTSLAQDLLVKTDSSKLKTVIKEINGNCIKYTLFDYENGPSFVIRRSDIAYIIFKNGVIEKYANEPKAQPDLQNMYDKYSLDGSRPQVIKEYSSYKRTKEKDIESLYRRKNFLAFNYMGLLNSTLSFTYMRDFRKDGFILHVPFSFGIGNPNITNSTYNANYLHSNNRNTYNLMNFQVGAGLLFAPEMNSSVNFLIGPSFTFAQYDMSTETSYKVADATQTNGWRVERWNNNFTLFRQNYGGSIGFLARFHHRFNMSLIFSAGCKKDTYDEKDPYGVEYINTQAIHARNNNDNVLPYASLAWSFGYRF